MLKILAQLDNALETFDLVLPFSFVRVVVHMSCDTDCCYIFVLHSFFLLCFFHYFKHTLSLVDMCVAHVSVGSFGFWRVLELFGIQDKIMLN